MYITRIFTVIMIVLLAWSCKTQQKVDNMASKNEIVKIDYSSGPTTYIYKTNGDYLNLVPISLSDDKTKILSYPHPKDIYYKGVLAVPTQLEGGYLLDNRGISKNVAFINMTYEDYSELKKAPAVDELFNIIVDANPIKELYNCGNRYQYKDVVAELNVIIKSNKLNKCRRVN